MIKDCYHFFCNGISISPHLPPLFFHKKKSKTKQTNHTKRNPPLSGCFWKKIYTVYYEPVVFKDSQLCEESNTQQNKHFFFFCLTSMKDDTASQWKCLNQNQKCNITRISTAASCVDWVWVELRNISLENNRKSFCNGLCNWTLLTRSKRNKVLKKIWINSHVFNHPVSKRVL